MTVKVMTISKGLAGRVLRPAWAGFALAGSMAAAAAASYLVAPGEREPAIPVPHTC